MERTPSLAVSLDDARELRQALCALRDLSYEWRDAGAVCRICGAWGAWPSEIPHGPMPGDGPNARPCRVARGLALLAWLAAWINANEQRAADAPIIDGGR